MKQLENRWRDSHQILYCAAFANTYWYIAVLVKIDQQLRTFCTRMCSTLCAHLARCSQHIHCNEKCSGQKLYRKMEHIFFQIHLFHKSYFFKIVIYNLFYCRAISWLGNCWSDFVHYCRVCHPFPAHFTPFITVYKKQEFMNWKSGFSNCAKASESLRCVHISSNTQLFVMILYLTVWNRLKWLRMGSNGGLFEHTN
jgi:hypothetical protein